MIDVAMNHLMRPIYTEAEHTDEALPPDVAAIAKSGLVAHDDLLLLRSYRRRLRTSPGKTSWDHERWVNDVGLGTILPASDPAWRARIVRDGLDLAQRLLREALSRTTAPVQVTIALQSAPSTVDPDVDFATGALHLYVLRSAEDDARTAIESYEQPVLALTVRA